MGPHARVIRMRREDLHHAVRRGGRVDPLLGVARCHVPFAREHPDLQQPQFLIGCRVDLAVRDTRAGAHHLHFARADGPAVAHAVLVGHRTGQRYGHDLHVLMRVRTESSAGGDGIVVQHPEHAEVHALRIVVVGETEGVEGLQPTVVGVSAGGGPVQDHVRGDGVFHRVRALVDRTASFGPVFLGPRPGSNGVHIAKIHHGK